MSDQVNMDAVLEKIVKLMKLGANNPNPHEAAAAIAKAQEIMTAYNLDMGSVERKSGAKDEKREKEAVYGGFYKYNRDLYEAVAKLNFCMYWTSEEDIQCELPPKNTKARNKWKALGCPSDFTVLRKVHKLLGRKVNVAATKVLAGYLEQAVERILREEMDAYNYGTTMIFSKWAFSFREGAVSNIVERIQEERDRAEKERQRKAAEEKVRNSHPSAAPSTSTALTLTDYQASEEAGNYDAMHGEGSWARRIALRSRWKSEAEMESEGLRCLAIFHPDEFKALKDKEAAELAEWIKKESKRKHRHSSGPKEKEVNEEAFNAGKKKAEDISLNQQIDHEKKKLLS